MASGPITSWQIDGEVVETVSDFLLGGSKSLQMVTATMKLKDAYSLEESYDWPRQHIKKQRHYFANKGPSSQGFFSFFPSSHVWKWELDHKEGWEPKNWFFQTVVLEKTLKSPLDCKIKPVHPKGNQSWIFIGRTDAEAEALILWPPHAKSWLTERPWCWQRMKMGGEGDNRGRDGWVASLTPWTWVWVNSGSWWWTGKPGVQQSMGSQRVRHDWTTEQQEVT